MKTAPAWTVVLAIGGMFGSPIAAEARSPESWESLESELASIVAETGVPGAAVSVVTEGGAEVRSFAFGAADRETERPVTADTLFRANSVSKSFVALAVLRLVEEGRLGLDDRVRDLLPEFEFENPWEESHPLRVAHLLEHTTGFDDLHFREYAFGPEDGTLREALAVNPAPRVARWPPGTRMAYNNGAYAVAAHLIETVSGERFEDFVEREVLRPLGMDASGFGLERIDRERLARHYLRSGDEEPPEPYPLLIRPAGGLITTADDLAALVTCLLRRGAPLLDPASVERMETPRTTDAARAGLRVGYGLGSYTSWGWGSLWHGHAGGTPSAFARYAYQPELGAGYALLLNGPGGAAKDRLERALQELLTGGVSAPIPDGDHPEPAGAPEDYAGLYRQSTSSWSLAAGFERLFDVRRVAVSDDPSDPHRLTVAPLLEEPSESLVPAGGDLFRAQSWAIDRREPTAVFLRDGEGRVTGLATWDADNLRAGNHERVSAIRAYGPPLAFGLSLLLVATALLVVPLRGLAGGVRRLRARPAPETPRGVHALPLLSVLALVGAVLAVVMGASGSDGLLALGRPGLAAVTFWLLTWAFALLSPLALAVAVRGLFLHPPAGWLRWTGRVHSTLVALACTTLAFFLVSWGIAGLRTWAF